MSAEIISLSDVRARRAKSDVETGVVIFENDAVARFHFWTGATGKRYVHTVYSLFDCPPVEKGNYVLVRRAGQAKRTILSIGRLGNESASLNLAEIRQRGAALGADEVHLHLLATCPHESQAVEVDLKTAQFATLSS